MDRAGTLRQPNLQVNPGLEQQQRPVFTRECGTPGRWLTEIYSCGERVLRAGLVWEMKLQHIDLHRCMFLVRQHCLTRHSRASHVSLMKFIV